MRQYKLGKVFKIYIIRNIIRLPLLIGDLSNGVVRDDFLDMVNTRECPKKFEDWISHSEYCYKIFVVHKVNWTEAELRCEKFGGNLVSIPTPQINAVITEKLRNKEVGHLWIGLTKTGRQK